MAGKPAFPRSRPRGPATLTLASSVCGCRPARAGRDGGFALGAAARCDRGARSLRVACRSQQDATGPAKDAVEPGVLEFAAFVAFLIVAFPLLGPRVPPFYHRTDALLNEVRHAQGKHGKVIIDVEDVPDPANGASSAASLMMATAHAEDVPARVRMLIVANVHGREIAAGEVALGCIRDLASGDLATSGAAGWHSLLDRGLELSVVPVANVEGRKLAEELRPCQRGTADVPLISTDVNRNFPVDWSPGVQYNYLSSSLDIHGISPFSTYQARVLGAIAKRHTWDAFVDLHTGTFSLNAPYGHRAEGSADLEEQLRALVEVRRLCPECKAGPSRAVMGYDNPGSLQDWMYEDRGVVYSYVWEVFAATGVCAPHFNPMEEEQLSALVMKWNRALVALGDYVLKHPRTASAV